MDEQENTSLIRSKVTDHSNAKGLKRYFISISVILIVFKGAEEMGVVTTKQFVYSWCQHHGDRRANVSARVTSAPDPTAGGSTGAAGVCGSGDTINVEDDAQRSAAQWELYFNLINAGLLLFSITVYGLISDYIGRKVFLCMAIAGFGIRSAIITCVVHYELHIAYMLLAYALDGVLGSRYAVSLYCYVMAADVTTNIKHRALGVVFIETFTGAGKTTTEFANGYFIHAYGFFYPMLTVSVGIIFKLLQLWFSDGSIACMGLVSAAMYFLDTGLANTDMWMFAGAVFAGIESCDLLCKLASNPASLALYSHTVSTMRGLVFLVQAGTNGLALVTMLVLRYLMNKNKAGETGKTVDI